jgi:hypothetical protein
VDYAAKTFGILVDSLGKAQGDLPQVRQRQHRFARRRMAASLFCLWSQLGGKTMIVRFTNARGKINYGIILAHGTQGCVQVLWDKFTELIEDLTQRAKLRPADEKSLGVRISWISLEPSPYDVAATLTEILPVDTEINWSNRDLLQAHTMRKANQETFDLWLAASWPDLAQKYVLSA